MKKKTTRQTYLYVAVGYDSYKQFVVVTENCAMDAEIEFLSSYSRTPEVIYKLPVPPKPVTSSKPSAPVVEVK